MAGSGRRSAVIVGAARTPLGKRNGMLAHWHPVDLAAAALTAVVDRTGVDPTVIDDVIMGCVMQVGEQGINIGRNAVLAAGWPDTIPGTTVDRQCGSSQQALHFAAQGVIAGAYDVAVAAGVEVMTRVPMGASMIDGQYGFPFGPSVSARYSGEGGLVSQGVAAELIADRWGIGRTEMDELSLESHRRAVAATREGHFDAEIVPVTDQEGRLVSCDEGIRETTLDALGRLSPSFRTAEEGGRVTAGNSSQIADGASAVLVTTEERARELGLSPRARVVDFALAASDPRLMLTATIPATAKILDRVGLSIDDIDLIEINEAFAAVVLAWEREVGPDHERVNVNGGAIALGHPLGCGGTRLTTTLLHELERRDGRYGLQTMCEGGGMANALLIERV
jgi:acetyl-CoA acetyltransferase family protein